MPPRMAEVLELRRTNGGTPPPLLPSPPIAQPPPPGPCHRATEGKAASRITVGACARACLSPSLPPPPAPPPPPPPPARVASLPVGGGGAEDNHNLTGADAPVSSIPPDPGPPDPVAAAARSDRPAPRPAGATLSSVNIKVQNGVREPVLFLPWADDSVQDAC
ncbi:unnamed protein product [Urochloa decumbens]|uniref:Uncharacterized protein n=1 Tax=Urochloa decumbens TaxID=240449 RepID=A0ABC9DM39_9POAL